MPNYDYICKKCGHEVEIFQSMKDDPIRKCPACGKLGLERQIGTGAGIIFKGGGFYETDYKRSSSSGEKSEKSGGDKSSGEKKSSESKSSKKKSSSAKAE